MRLNQVRYSTSQEDTCGLLFEDDRFLSHTLEDEYRAVKVYGETRIPAGTYHLALRTEGRLHGIYSDKYNFHKGMLWIQDVPKFKWIYFHTGVNDDHTAGCILVGDQVRQNQLTPGEDNLMLSRQAYRRIYSPIAKAIGEEGVTLRIMDSIEGLKWVA